MDVSPTSTSSASLQHLARNADGEEQIMRDGEFLIEA